MDEIDDNEDIEEDALTLANQSVSLVKLDKSQSKKCKSYLESDEEANDDDDYDIDDLKDEDYQIDAEEEEEESSSNEDTPLEDLLDDDVDQFIEAPEHPWIAAKGRKRSLAPKREKKQASVKVERVVDDGDERAYRKRLSAYRLHLHETKLDVDDEFNAMHILDDGELQLPKRIWDRLFSHQRECLQWLWGLHKNLCGGIIGDEMGLGKTIQVIAFLVALRCTTYRQLGHLYHTLGPVLLVCPATVMWQWVGELHHWWPEFRVAILHSSGSFHRKNSKTPISSSHSSSHSDRNVAAKRKLIRELVAAKNGGILITTYQGVCVYHKLLTECDWHYVILDEGHKIRNPDAMVTHCCKLVKTPHRLILSGSPIQNNLRELWSLFDFVYPGKLGELNTFYRSVVIPIRRGSYRSATKLDIRIAYRTTMMLRDSIKPYLLRRTKDDVNDALRLPAKNEQVLFCKLTPLQRDLYERYINESEVVDALLNPEIARRYLGQFRSSENSKRSVLFAALIKLRKICNHPYLFNPLSFHNNTTPGTSDDTQDSVPLSEQILTEEFFHQSGKMAVIDELLQLWYKQHHKVLLFTQSRRMLDLLEHFACRRKYNYRRMDGQTSISSRQMMIDSFNRDPSIFIFLLTTKVGGLGVNLTGADRVVIYDPDWNPCTDMQARERCWRIGQNREVIIYRLLTAGTVEEKIYHRQIYKQYLTNSVLKSPNHRRFTFKSNHMRELFTLNTDSFNETSLMFSESKVKFDMNSEEEVDEVMEKEKESCKKKKHKKSKTFTSSMIVGSSRDLLGRSLAAKDFEVKLSEEKLQELREKAKELNKKFLEKFLSNPVGGKGGEEESGVERNGSGTELEEHNTYASITQELPQNSKSQSQPSTSKLITIAEASIGEKSLKSDVVSKSTSSGIGNGKRRIEYLVGQETFHDINDDDDDDNSSDDDHDGYHHRKRKRKDKKKNKKHKKSKQKSTKTKEDNVLRKLLALNSLDVVLQHDSIENVSVPDHELLDIEAERVAKEAIDTLRNRPISSSFNRPYYTTNSAMQPQFGSSSSSFSSSSSSSSKPMFGKRSSNSSSSGFIFDQPQSNSSASLIAWIKQRSEVNVTSNSSANSNLTNSNRPSMRFKDDNQIHDHLSMADQLRDFIHHGASLPNQATTDEILRHFDGRLPPEKCSIFKSLLKSLCDRERLPMANGNGSGFVWKLKQEFC